MSCLRAIIASWRSVAACGLVRDLTLFNLYRRDARLTPRIGKLNLCYGVLHEIQTVCWSVIIGCHNLLTVIYNTWGCVCSKHWQSKMYFPVVLCNECCFH